MTRLDFRPGSGWSAAGDGIRFVAGADAEVVGRAADALVGGFGAAVDVLVAGGVSAMPDVVVVDGAGDDGVLRVLVRGAVALVVESGDRRTELTGRGVTTWSEQAFPEWTTWTAEVPGGRWSARGDGERDHAADGRASEATVLRPARDTGHGSRPVSEETLDPEATIVPTADGIGAPPASGAGSAVQDTVVEDTVVEDTVVAGAVAGRVAQDGDHDGETVHSDQVRALLAARSTASATPQQAGSPAVSPAPAASSPSAPSTPADVPAPALELADGAREPITRPIVVGRAPSASKVQGGDVPRLLKVGGEDPDISRTHARVAIEGGTVVVTDLHSRNGTVVILPGKPPQRLRAGEPSAVLDGTVIDLGGGVTMTVRAG